MIGKLEVRMAAWKWTLTALVALSTWGCAMQATGRAPRHTGMNRDPSPVDVSALGIEEVEGRVESIDRGRGVLVVAGEGAEVRLEAAKETAVFVEGGVGGLADLHEGTTVRASFVEEDGKRVARWIEIPRSEDGKERDGLQKAGQEVAR